MALKIFIYGSPEGFQSVGTTPDENAYFQRLYVTSRTGKRLMVNRRPDGSTSYNYLVYGVRGNRPNAFFGMSFMLTGGMYAADFAKLYGIFDDVFRRMVANKILIEDNGGMLQYNALNLDLAGDQTNWIRAELTGALGQSGISFQQYDLSFVSNDSGQIALYNINTPNSTILQGFRAVQWIAVSPAFATAEPQEEIDAEDLQDAYTAQLSIFADIAISQSRNQLPTLEHIRRFAHDSAAKLTKCKASVDPQKYMELIGQLSDLDKKVRLLIERIEQQPEPQPQPTPSPHPQPQPTPNPAPAPNPRPGATKRCMQCMRLLDVSHFAPGVAICNDCLTQKSKRKCRKCGKVLPVEYFDGNSPICRNCAEQSLSLLEKLRKELKNPKVIAVGAVVMAVFIFVLILPGKPDPDPVVNVFEKQKFERLLAVDSLTEAYSMLPDMMRVSGNEYRQELVESVKGVAVRDSGLQKVKEIFPMYTEIDELKRYIADLETSAANELELQKRNQYEQYMTTEKDFAAAWNIAKDYDNLKSDYISRVKAAMKRAFDNAVRSRNDQRLSECKNDYKFCEGIEGLSNEYKLQSRRSIAQSVADSSNGANGGGTTGVSESINQSVDVKIQEVNEFNKIVADGYKHTFKYPDSKVIIIDASQGQFFMLSVNKPHKMGYTLNSNKISKVGDNYRIKADYTGSTKSIFLVFYLDGDRTNTFTVKLKKE